MFSAQLKKCFKAVCVINNGDDDDGDYHNNN